MYVEIQCYPEKAQESGKDSLKPYILIGSKEGEQKQHKKHVLVRAVPAHKCDISRDPGKGHDLDKVLGDIGVPLISHDESTEIAQETHDTHDGCSGIMRYKEDYCLDSKENVIKQRRAAHDDSCLFGLVLTFHIQEYVILKLL